jgi:hypothetical protein
MLVVSDIEDVYLPKPNDLLVNLTEARASLETLLTRLNTMFADNLSVGSALGAALQAAFKMIVSIRLLSASLLVSHAFNVQSASGGKISVLSASLPTEGPGALKNREDPKVLGTAKVREIPYGATHRRADVASRSLLFFKPPPRSTRLSRSSARARKYRSTCSCSAPSTKTSLPSVDSFAVLPQMRR